MSRRLCASNQCNDALMPKAPSAKKPFDYGTPRFEDVDIDWLAARPWPRNAKQRTTLDFSRRGIR